MEHRTLRQKVGPTRKRPRCVRQKVDEVRVPGPAWPIRSDENGRSAFRLDPLQDAGKERKGGEKVKKVEPRPRKDQGVHCESFGIAGP